MKNQVMFPFRRNGPKKRGKGGGGRRPHDGGGGGGGRRVPGSAAELLPMMQPTTKALAQMLAGNTKSSGQLVHARNILAQATRMVDERHVDRLPPAAREEFFEQLARLKLTIGDAEEAGLAGPEPALETAAPAAPMGADRLREVALRLATSAGPSTTYVPGTAIPYPIGVESEEDEQASPTEDGQNSGLPTAAGADDPRRLRPAERPEVPADENTATGPRRERLRLKSVRSSEG